MNILGISAYFHNSAASLIIDGRIIAQASEERFTRVKNDGGFPKNAIDYCLKAGNLKVDNLDEIVFYTDPGQIVSRFWKNVVSAKEHAEQLCRSTLRRVEERIWIQNAFYKYYHSLGKNCRMRVVRHHISHAASAFYPSPFQNAVILTMDGVGEWESLTIGRGNSEKIELLESINYPHSIGLFYSALSYFCGFNVNSGEYKFMGLAPYGRPKYKKLILENLIDVKDDGSFSLNIEYYSFYKGDEIIDRQKFEELFGIKKREVDGSLRQAYIDIAASTQAALEEIVLKIVAHAKRVFGLDTNNLVLAGGVALNCVCNGKIARKGIFENIWVQPVADDAGGALGAALFVYYELGGKRIPDYNAMHGTFLGPDYSDEEIRKELCHIPEKAIYYKLDAELIRKVAELLAQKKVIGLFRGKMEAGPRALGHRSIIADPSSEEMQNIINLKIKKRESFRPFAPIVMAEYYDEYFEPTADNSYMTYTTYLKKDKRFAFSMNESVAGGDLVDLIEIVNQPKSEVPAVTHVDYSARVQTVNKEANPFLWNVLNEFYRLKGCPMLVNTSFNVRGEPIVCTPRDAYRCFLTTEMDALVIGNFLIEKQ